VRDRKKRTARRDPRVTLAPDLVRRNFAAGAPDRFWKADIAYARTDEGSLHPAFVLGACSRRIVG
jgi:putative transposase